MPQDLISSVLPAVLIGLIGLVVGVVAGYLLAGLLAPGPTEPQRPKNLVEAARLWQEKRSGKWIIEIDGQLVNDPNLLTVHQREVLQKAQDELPRWVGGASLPAQAAAAEPIPPTVKVAARSASGPLDSSLPPARPVSGSPANPQPPARPPSGPLASRLSASRPASGSLDNPPPPARPLSGALANPQSPARPVSGTLANPNRPPSGGLPGVQPVSTDLPGILAKPLFGEVKDSGPLKSIAGQVDDILQERLPASPYRDHVIRMQDSPSMGIQVFVDGQIFEGVGDVPYPDIQQFIRECVVEWERRSAKRGA